MKNLKLIIASAALLLSFNSFAQFGIIAGLTSSSTNIKDAYAELKGKAIAQYHVGITAKLELGKVFAIQPSLIYNVKGSRLADFSTRTIDYKTGFIELPIQLQVGVPLGKIIRLYGIAEPFIGYAVSNKIDGAELKDKWANISNKFEYGVGLGAGVELFEHLQVAVRYFWNLGNVYDFSVHSIIDAPKGKCSGISASVAFLF